MADSYEILVGENRAGHQVFLLLTSMCMCLMSVVASCIVVYETSGQYVTSFGRPGLNEGEFQNPVCITSCVDGFIHLCDWYINRVQIF